MNRRSRHYARTQMWAARRAMLRCIADVERLVKRERVEMLKKLNPDPRVIACIREEIDLTIAETYYHAREMAHQAFEAQR